MSVYRELKSKREIIDLASWVSCTVFLKLNAYRAMLYVFTDVPEKVVLKIAKEYAIMTRVIVGSHSYPLFDLGTRCFTVTVFKHHELWEV